MHEPRILLSAGGTGGHIFPAIALAEELTKYSCSILFSGGNLSKNPFFEKEHYPYKEVSCGQLSLVPWKFVSGSWDILKGVQESISIIQAFNPDLVVGFGSYYTLPVLIAAKCLGKPIFLHEANTIPGKVNKLFSPFVEQTCVHFPRTQALLKGKTVVGGMPLRSNFRKGQISKEEARKSFQLDPRLTTILVFGGSQGSKRINELFSEAALFHLKEMIPPFQILHFTGNHADAELLMGRYVSGNVAAYVRPFEKKMELAWAASDLSITRAGAASIAEQMEYAVPGLLIPFPFSSDGHQDANAEVLEETGLGAKAAEDELTPQALAGKVQELYMQQKERVERFREYKKNHFESSFSEQIYQWLLKHQKIHENISK